VPVYLVMIGAPGAGKGTQARLIATKFGLVHISSGDLFRENIKNHTELGKLAQSFISRGELVPDELTIRMVEDRLSREDCVNGAVLDGFPRTPTQAQALSERRCTCRAQGHIYHQQFNPPKVAGICDEDGSELYHREDDSPATVRNRIAVYMEQTWPLIEHYLGLGILVEINGNQPIEKVQADLLAALPSEV